MFRSDLCTAYVQQDNDKKQKYNMLTRDAVLKLRKCKCFWDSNI